MIIYGAAACNWAEKVLRKVGGGRKQSSVYKTIIFKGKEVYVDIKKYLLGAIGASVHKISRGIHRFRFSILLPPTLPPSLKISNGGIRYTMEVVLDHPLSVDTQLKLDFTVVRNDDLNMLPELKVPCAREEIKTFKSFFRKSDEFNMIVTIPQSGYVPGQNIPVTINYINKSSVKVERTKICLKKIIRYIR